MIVSMVDTEATHAMADVKVQLTPDPKRGEPKEQLILRIIMTNLLYLPHRIGFPSCIRLSSSWIAVVVGTLELSDDGDISISRPLLVGFQARFSLKSF